jgi:SagB-type dehydrogenase family enzyme
MDTVSQPTAVSSAGSGPVRLDVPKKSSALPLILAVVFGLLAIGGWSMYVWQAGREPMVVEKEVVREVPVVDTSATADMIQAVAPIEKVFVGESVVLPTPFLKGKVSVEEAIAMRRSRRAFADRPVNQKELAQVLFAAQGVTDKETGKRAAPSAFETYPYDVYVVVRKVDGLKPGLYLYHPTENSVQPVKYAEALLSGDEMQGTVKNAPLVLVYGAVFARMQDKVPDFAEAKNYTYQEAGHIIQNVYLATEGFGMATVTTVGFDESAVRAGLGIGADTEIIALQPFGARVE